MLPKLPVKGSLWVKVGILCNASGTFKDTKSDFLVVFVVWLLRDCAPEVKVACD